tara:strand:+ start:2140 stop:3177 length:1038 start_codon:yes stop_codon:yes gene_type:complete
MTLRLTKRDNGIWQVSGTHNGVKIGRTSLGIRNKREAEVELQRKIDAGEFGRSDDYDYTVQEAYDVWLQERGRDVAQQTLRTVQKVMDHFGSMKIKDIDDRSIINYLATLTNVSGGRRTYVSYLRTVLRLGCKRLKTDLPPVDWADVMPPRPPARSLTYTEAERERIIKAAYEYAKSTRTVGDDRLWGHYVLTLMRTGARPGELCDLKWPDVHDEHIVLYSKKGKGKVLKGRSVPLSDEVKDVLDEIDRTSEYVFAGLSQDGRKMSVHSLVRSFKSIVTKAGLPGHAYILRHTFGTYVARKSGGNPAVVQGLMGHSDIGTTMNYIKPLEDDMRQAVDAYSKKGGE